MMKYLKENLEENSGFYSKLEENSLIVLEDKASTVKQHQVDNTSRVSNLRS